MVSLSTVATFAALAVVIVAIPGPSVLFIVGRALELGRRPALISVLGNAAGVSAHILLVAFGAGAILSASPLAFSLLKVAGGGYLAWLGVMAIRHRHDEATPRSAERAEDRRKRGLWSVARQAFAVGILNPKTLVFFAATLPAFVDPSRGAPWAQALVLGAVFQVIAVTGDSAYAIAASGVRHWFGGSPERLARLRATGGALMIVLGIVLALTPHGG